MHRYALNTLRDWADQPNRKPLILRGARQVGKSFLVRMLANDSFDSLAEVNFEQTPELAELFESKQPQRIVSLLETQLNQPIRQGKTLLFLDEIQATPQVIPSLRYFYEQMPGLHVIAAGSLLEFTLDEHVFSMPVGRIEYMHLGPMCFEEFLLALNKQSLRDFIQSCSLSEAIPKTIHNTLMLLVKDYCLVGGMPESIQRFAATQSYLESEKATSSILSTYHDDFSKYGTRVNHQRIKKVFTTIPRLVGSKLKYTQIDREEKSRDLKQALHKLEQARVIYRVQHSHANGVPLGAEANEKHFKTLFLDVGLLCRSCGLTMANLRTTQDLMLINSGAVCEQYVGQHLLYSGQYYDSPELYYWLRQQGSSNAEVDYVIQSGTHIIPVEVKAGKTGSLKSLHLFLSEKKRHFGLRFNADSPSLVNAKTSVAGRSPHPFQLLSLPLYLISQTKRLCQSVLEEPCSH
jgi:predicted AAA+ superfamily ATPase